MALQGEIGPDEAESLTEILSFAYTQSNSRPAERTLICWQISFHLPRMQQWFERALDSARPAKFALVLTMGGE
jgi:hypothetical protein